MDRRMTIPDSSPSSTTGRPSRRARARAVERGAGRRLRAHDRQSVAGLTMTSSLASSPTDPRGAVRICRSPEDPDQAVAARTGRAIAAEPSSTWLAKVSSVSVGRAAGDVAVHDVRRRTGRRGARRAGAHARCSRAVEVEEPAAQGDHQPIDQLERQITAASRPASRSPTTPPDRAANRRPDRRRRSARQATPRGEPAAIEREGREQVERAEDDVQRPDRRGRPGRSRQRPADRRRVCERPTSSEPRRWRGSSAVRRAATAISSRGASFERSVDGPHRGSRRGPRSTSTPPRRATRAWPSSCAVADSRNAIATRPPTPQRTGVEVSGASAPTWLTDGDHDQRQDDRPTRGWIRISKPATRPNGNVLIRRRRRIAAAVGAGDGRRDAVAARRDDRATTRDQRRGSRSRRRWRSPARTGTGRAGRGARSRGRTCTSRPGRRAGGRSRTACRRRRAPRPRAPRRATASTFAPRRRPATARPSIAGAPRGDERGRRPRRPPATHSADEDIPDVAHVRPFALIEDRGAGDWTSKSGGPITRSARMALVAVSEVRRGEARPRLRPGRGPARSRPTPGSGTGRSRRR